MTSLYNKIFNNLEIILNIGKYLIEPSILITGHYYDKTGKLILLKNNIYTEKQINSYIQVLCNKYKYYINIHTNYTLLHQPLLLYIIDDINDINIFWRNINHSIYIDLNYLKYINSEFGIYSYIHQQNKISKFHLQLFYSIFENYNLQIISKKLDEFLLLLRIHKFQLEISYIHTYFDEFLELNNNNLSMFIPSNILNFIKSEELILSTLLENDEI